MTAREAKVWEYPCKFLGSTTAVPEISVDCLGTVEKHPLAQTDGLIGVVFRRPAVNACAADAQCSNHARVQRGPA